MGERRTSLICAALTLLLTASSLSADTGWLLRLKLKAGKTHNYSMT